MPNKLSQVWQELKRRNVVRVITVYAGAAFVILELVDILSPSLGLPQWTMNLVLILLIVGFFIAVIVSWIYDIQPEGGIVKTKSADKVKIEDVPKSSNSWKIASYVSFVVIVGLVVLNIIPRSEKRNILEKSIAILPFSNESSEEVNTYFINGMMESILNNLCSIEDLRVVSRNSVEKYRNEPKPTPVVAEEMDVSYVLEGSGQKLGNRLLLTIQLIVGKDDRHIWSKQYDREIDKMEDLIDIQKEVAQLIVEEIEAIITPQEQDLIEKLPTTNLTAWDFYQRGMEEIEFGSIDRAEELFNDALSYDSTFANAYVGLARVYIYGVNPSDYYSEHFMDTVLILSNIALSYDRNLSEAYTARAYYYSEVGKTNLALEDLDKAIALNPNNADAYYIKYLIYYGSDDLESIKASHKLVSVDRTGNLNDRFNGLAFSFMVAGFFNQSYYYYEEALKLDRDSARYFSRIAEVEYWQGNISKSVDLYRKSLALDSTSARPYIYLAKSLCEADKCEEALKYARRYINLMDEQGIPMFEQEHRIAYIYWRNGMIKEAEFHFSHQIEICEQEIVSNRRWAQKYYSYYDLAGVFAFRGEKEKAIENLSIVNQIELAPYWLDALMTRDELFESIRDEPEFLQIARDIEVKYQANHERVRQWLEENDIL